jgi:hypothetical protein
VHVEQCSRAGEPPSRVGSQELVLRGFRCGRSSRCCDLHPDPDRQAQRRRPAEGFATLLELADPIARGPGPSRPWIWRPSNRALVGYVGHAPADRNEIRYLARQVFGVRRQGANNGPLGRSGKAPNSGFILSWGCLVPGEKTKAPGQGGTRARVGDQRSIARRRCKRDQPNTDASHFCVACRAHCRQEKARPKATGLE